MCESPANERLGVSLNCQRKKSDILYCSKNVRHEFVEFLWCILLQILEKLHMEDIDFAKLVPCEVELRRRALGLPKECRVHLHRWSQSRFEIYQYWISEHITEVLVKATIGMETSGRLALFFTISVNLCANTTPTDFDPLK
jgi:hypothetical protein